MRLRITTDDVGRVFWARLVLELEAEILQAEDHALNSWRRSRSDGHELQELLVVGDNGELWITLSSSGESEGSQT